MSTSLSDEELTAANVLAVKTLVNVTQAYPGVSVVGTTLLLLPLPLLLRIMLLPLCLLLLLHPRRFRIAHFVRIKFHFVPGIYL